MRADRPRCGFTLIEAVVALAIIGVVTVGAFAAYGTQLRAEGRAQEAWTLEALAEERLAALALAESAALRTLPDTLRRGRFAAPFARYRWTAAARTVHGERDLWELAVTVSAADSTALTLRTRRFRPPPRVVEETR
ncbi:MAG TPA: prepilin-type N-terminal cleavage/methylation domain-containing protein [Gemmatimonadaceae bacterium]|nr:prepilin-type N-terminal cleavage/methylation domain-containing protein [Gemmatimonadaceae bacterium]